MVDVTITYSIWIIVFLAFPNSNCIYAEAYSYTLYSLYFSKYYRHLIVHYKF